jgi:alanyl-tRNA synthetase
MVIHVDAEYVVLDQSLFCAESGGQEWDEGCTDDQRVIDVQDQSGRLLHLKLPLVRFGLIP